MRADVDDMLGVDLVLNVEMYASRQRDLVPPARDSVSARHPPNWPLLSVDVDLGR